MNTSLILIIGALLGLSSPVLDDGPAPGSRWDWPLRPTPVLARGFAVGPNPWSPGHRGVDLVGRAAQPVLAPSAGTVSFVGVVAGTPVISIDHGGGSVSSLEPVRARVRRGQRIEIGSVVGDLIGAGPGSHCLPRSCLHWGLRRDGVYADPLELLGPARGPAVLLPLGDRWVP